MEEDFDLLDGYLQSPENQLQILFQDDNQSSIKSCEEQAQKKICENRTHNDVSAVCGKCVQVEIDLQKSKAVIKKLQARCVQKTAEIKRLRAAEKRSKIAKCNLGEMLREMKEKNWISNEGQEILNVNDKIWWKV